MVLAISFMEAPLKFHVPGVSLQVALSIGRVVFFALNICELLFALVLGSAVYSHDTPLSLDLACAVAITALMIQLLMVRPTLARHTTSVLGGDEGPRSGSHYVYVGLEVVKVIALITSGVILTGL
ncbi:MAG: hypothetical protein WCE30_18885 [Mycobacterium sp.]